MASVDHLLYVWQKKQETKTVHKFWELVQNEHENRNPSNLMSAWQHEHQNRYTEGEPKQDIQLKDCNGWYKKKKPN